MFLPKIFNIIHVGLKKMSSSHCTINLCPNLKKSSQFMVSVFALSIFAVSITANYVLAAQTENIPYITVEPEEISDEILTKSINILCPDTLKESINEFVDEKSSFAQQEAFLESIDVFSKDYSSIKDLKDNIIQIASDFKIDRKTLEAALIKAEENFATPYLSPVSGRITSNFGYRKDPFSGRKIFHSGLDIQDKFDSPVCSSAYGTVIFAAFSGGYGKLVQIDHGNGIITSYAHLNKITCKEGDTVPAGAPIGTMGRTGQVTGFHLHYEVSVNGENVNPLNYISDITKLSFQ